MVAIGNPPAAQTSVVSGVISGLRQLEGKTLIQLAMPIEQGNSGGPVLDRSGHVLGLVTMKSAVSENLGFAVAVNSLKPLLEKAKPPFPSIAGSQSATSTRPNGNRISEHIGDSGRDASLSKVRASDSADARSWRRSGQRGSQLSWPFGCG